jgi:hypothetical protein
VSGFRQEMGRETGSKDAIKSMGLKVVRPKEATREEKALNKLKPKLIQ